MKFHLPIQGNAANRFQRLQSFIAQFDPNWFKHPEPATEEEIAQLKDTAGISHHLCTCGLKTFPKEYQWFAENFGKSGINLSFNYHLSLSAIAHNHSINHHPHSPYFYIGNVWISPYLAYYYPDNNAEPCLVWVPSLDSNSPCYQAADSLEQLLFASAFLNYTYYEYEFKIKCSFPSYSIFVEYVKQKFGTPTEHNYEAICTTLMKQVSSILQSHQFECAWFSTYSDQFWFQDDLCFILSRNNDPDTISDFVVGYLGSHTKHGIEHIVSIMKCNGFSCTPIFT